MIIGSVKGDEKVITRLKALPPSVRSSLVDTVTRLSINLQSYVVTNKLSGQVLKRKTGTLARSIQWAVSNTPAGVIGTVGSRIKEKSPLKYARPHEYGFKGPVTVKAHLRKITMVFGKPIEPMTVTVAQHTMNMNMPVRSYLRTSLKENKDDITAKIKQSISKGVKK